VETVTRALDESRANSIARYRYDSRLNRTGDGMLSLRLVIGVLAVSLAIAQNAERPQFEVASVKPADSASPPSQTSYPGTWTCMNCRLFDLFGYAYKVFEYQLAAPDWTKSAKFDVIVKFPPGVKPGPWAVKADEDAFAVRMRNLLEE
jgi:hypothetical protein